MQQSYDYMETQWLHHHVNFVFTMKILNNNFKNGQSCFLINSTLNQECNDIWATKDF